MTSGKTSGGTLDESKLPLLVVTYPRDATPEMLDALFENYRRIARSNDRVAYLIDMRELDIGRAGAPVRRRAGELHARYRVELARSAVCEARVVSSQLMRGVLVAFDWIKGDGLWPCQTFTTMRDAEVWTEEQLAKR